MKAGDRIFMLRYSASRPVFEVVQGGYWEAADQFGVAAVSNVSWSEKRGAMETLISERWMLVAPNIWLSTSQKK